MFLEKVKKYLEDISTLKFLAYSNFVIVDVNEKSCNLVHIKANSSILNIFNTKVPKHNILNHRAIETPDCNLFEINRELRIISDKHKLNNAVLVLILNNYKSFNIAISKDRKEDGDDLNISELIKTQLPQNLINSDFFIQFEKTGEDENVENYIVAVIRRQELQKFNEIVNNEIIQIRFVIPSIFLLANQLVSTKPITDLIEINPGKSVHSQITNDKKIFIDELYNTNDGIPDFQEIITRVLTDLPANKDENDEVIKSNIVFCTDMGNSTAISKVINQNNTLSNLNFHYSISNYAKHQLAFLKCLNDKILNYNADDLFAVKQKVDIERNLTNRFVIGAFGLLLILLLILNISNMFIDNSISDISEQKENKKTIEMQVDQLNIKNTRLKADLLSINNLKSGNQKISQILRIISESYIDQMVLTDLRLIKNESNNFDIKLNGESFSKNEVIAFIKNLESNKSLHSIELVGMNKNNETLIDGINSKYDYKFSITMKFNDNKKS